MAPVYFLGWVRVTLKTVERISKQFDAYILAVSSFQFGRCELLNRNKGGIINEIRSLVTRIETLVSLSLYRGAAVYLPLYLPIYRRREGRVLIDV